MNSKGKPNVVIFLLDTQKSNNVSCYGYPKKTTPNIDRLAGEGAVFLDNVSPAIWTLPSTASILTGLHVHSHGACAHNDTFVDEPVTIADTLTKLKYQTVAFYANNYCAMSKKGFFETHRAPEGVESMGRDCHVFSRRRVERAINWLEFNYLDVPPESRLPFFLFIQVMDPHMPLYPPSPYKEQFLLEGATEEEIKACHLEAVPINAGEVWPSQRQFDILRSLSDAEAATADSHVGVLADYMRKKGILDETIFIVTSDHGDMFGEHDVEGKHACFAHHLCLYEELIRVPLVARYPAAIPAATRVASSTQTHDIFPTLAELIGFEAPWCQGFSLLPATRGNPARKFTLTEYMKSTHMAVRILDRMDPKMDVRLYLRNLKAFRKDGFKYIWKSDRHDELFDLREDPKERLNLIERMPEEANQMRIEMEDFLATLPYALRGDKVVTARSKPESVQRLQGLEFFQEIL